MRNSKGQFLKGCTNELNSRLKKGLPSPFKGKCHSDETKLKISLSKKKSSTRYWLGKKRTEEDKLKMSLARIGRFTGKNSAVWKGDDVKYRSLHKWVERQLGQPRFCEDCGNRELNHRQYHWANVSGNYKRIINDWRRLCVKCHKAFDSRVKSLILSV